MRLIDADELMEHAMRDKLDSRELILQMIKNAPTINEWVDNKNETVSCPRCHSWFYKENAIYMRFCGHCGAKMLALDTYYRKI